ncbi:MAG TPA: hypothetical protein VF649_03470 [Sphingomonas sp.]|jgi:surface polysaccharide O-acyltransferase-like enzyme|uniref:hypothetical protein n=1 Tax=Sphingomonas sp. TaxID=28214 RepID=UPI002ED823B3
MVDRRPPAWFAPKRLGYGTSLPIAWQGWVAIILLLAGLMLARRELSGASRWWAILVLIAVFTILCWRRTEGGWRRR